MGVLAPERKIPADNFDGKGLGRLNDLVADKKGGVYFNGAGTFYVTNGMVIVVFDVQPDGSVKHQRDFAKLEAGGAGDGMAIDAAGRLYVSSAPGVQVLSPEGKYLGLIPTPRSVISVAFSGPGKRTLYAVGSGTTGPDGGGSEEQRENDLRDHHAGPGFPGPREVGS